MKRTQTGSAPHRRSNRHRHRTHHQRSPKQTPHQPRPRLLAQHSQTRGPMAGNL